MTDFHSPATSSYLFINSVVAAMAGDEYPLILAQVSALGFSIPACPDAAELVHPTHETALRGTVARPLIDQRCPLIRQIVFQE